MKNRLNRTHHAMAPASCAASPELKSFVRSKFDRFCEDSDILRKQAGDSRHEEELVSVVCQIAAQWQAVATEIPTPDKSRELEEMSADCAAHAGVIFSAVAKIIGGEGQPFRIVLDPALNQVSSAKTCLGKAIRKIRELNKELESGDFEVPGRDGKLVRLADASAKAGFQAIAEYLEQITQGLVSVHAVEPPH